MLDKLVSNKTVVNLYKNKSLNKSDNTIITCLHGTKSFQAYTKSYIRQEPFWQGISTKCFPLYPFSNA